MEFAALVKDVVGNIGVGVEFGFEAVAAAVRERRVLYNASRGVNISVVL